MNSGARHPGLSARSTYSDRVEMLHLRYFVAVAEELNFSAAARRLHMASSPLSQRVKDLERELGQQLFVRSTHHVRLTPAGVALLPIAREALAQINAIPWRLRDAVESQSSSLAIGIPQLLHPDLRTRLAALLDRMAPRYDITRLPGSTPALITAVSEGRVDVAVVRLPVSDPTVSRLTVISERMGAVLPADRFAGRHTVALADLVDLPYTKVSMDNLPVRFERLDRELADLGISKRITVPEISYEGVFELISDGAAFSITILDQRSPVHQSRVDGVVVLPISDFQPTAECALIWLTERTDGDLRDFLDIARETFPEPLER